MASGSCGPGSSGLWFQWPLVPVVPWFQWPLVPVVPWFQWPLVPVVPWFQGPLVLVVLVPVVLVLVVLVPVALVPVVPGSLLSVPWLIGPWGDALCGQVPEELDGPNGLLSLWSFPGEGQSGDGQRDATQRLKGYIELLRKTVWHTTVMF